MLRVLLLLLLITGFGKAEEFIVRLQNPDDINSLNVKIKKKLSDHVYLVDMDRNIAGILVRMDGVTVEENHRLHKLANVPNDPCINDKWEFDIIKAYDAWQTSTGSQDVYVAVLDTGVNYNHPDLRDNVWKNPDEVCYDGVDNDNNGYVDDCYGVNVLCYPNGTYDPQAPGCNAPDALDDDGHGTHIAGIIGAVGNNGLLISGVNWRVKIVPCKFLDASGNGDIAGEIACLEYIKQLKRSKNLNIVAVNASYGNYYPSHQIQRDTISSLENLDILYVTAAGNDGVNIETRNFFPCGYDLGNEICVGASDRQDSLAWFSNYGLTKVKVLAPGEKILSLRFNSTSADCSALASYDGTSMATPFVTGAVALLKSADSSLTASEVKRRILLSASNKGELYGKVYSCGRLDLSSLLSSQPDATPKICLSASTLDFGTVSVGSSSRRTLTVRNAGFANIKVDSIVTDNQSFYVESETCTGTVLGPLQECRVNVSFSPSTASYIRGSLSIAYDGSSVATVELTGNSVQESASGGGSTLESSGCSLGNGSGPLLSVLLALLLIKLGRKRSER